jgi:vacuolar protein sorting-associated protein 52
LVETKLAGFVEEIVAPPGLVNILVNGEVIVIKNSDI